jgi:hypothetical protein
VTGNSDIFRQKASAFRNTKNWAKKKRDEFIEAANGKITSLHQNISFESSGYSEPSISTNRIIDLEFDTSAEELALNDKMRTQRSGKRLKKGESERNYRKYRSGRRGRPMR